MRILIPIFLLFIACNSVKPDQVSTKSFDYMQSIKIPYGPDSLQFGNLMLPDSVPNSPVIMIIHGGCWRSMYDYTLMDSMAVDLSKRGYATWNIEYRRTEDEGGRWPGTITDVALALRALKDIAKDYPIDLNNIIVVGHSAGGHLALMLGAQTKMDAAHPLKINELPAIKGIVSLAGVTDLATYLAPEGCGGNVLNLVGGTPEEFQDRYISGSPISYLPLGIPQVLITGRKDDVVPIDHIRPYIDKAAELDDPIRLIAVREAGHFDVITPGSVAWDEIVDAVGDLLNK